MLWTVQARREQDRQLLGEIDDYTRLEIVLRHNAISRWSIDLPAAGRGAPLLADAGRGIVVTADQQPVISGPTSSIRRTRSGERDTVTVAGADDTVWLARRLAHPQPGTAAPPYDTQAYDVRTGVCSTVMRQYVDLNAGPLALTPRRVPGLVLGPDPAAGGNTTGYARWQPLLELLQSLATPAGLGFRVVQVGTDLQYQVFVPVDRSDTQWFSDELGNLADFAYATDAPAANYVVCGGGGEGTARVVREGQDSASVARWGRIEMFRDRRDTTDTAVMDRTIREELVSNTETRSADTQLLELAHSHWPTSYGLGDRVRVILPDATTLVEQIREIRVSLTAEGEVTGSDVELVEVIRPRVAAVPKPRSQFAAADQTTVDDLVRRVTQLERTK